MVNIRFFFNAFLFNFRQMTSGRSDFWLTIALSLLKHIMVLVSWYSFFNCFFEETEANFKGFMFVIGVINVGVGFVEVFFDGLRDIPECVQGKTVWQHLIRPVDTLLSLAVSKSSPSSLSDILCGFIFIAVSGRIDAGVFIIILSSSIIFFSLYLYLSSISFFIQDSNDSIRELYSKSLFLIMQPEGSLRGFMRIIYFSIIPVGFLPLFSNEYFKSGHLFAALSLLIFSLGFFCLAITFFKFGLKKYERDAS